MKIIVRNYNRFLTGTKKDPKWEDLYIHRWASDIKKLVKFESRETAQEFLDSHRELSKNFVPWLVPLETDNWSN